MFNWLKRKNIENDIKEADIVYFDSKAWEAFVKFINKGIKDTNSNRVYIKYNYIGVDYDYLIYKYIVKNGKYLGINFFVHDNPKNTLSCNLINRVSSVEEAIKFITELKGRECLITS